jgi:nucleotide-binding universal stress UspA family protein
MVESPETVLIAWNGGREASRALSAALPILKQAKLVIVVSVGDLKWGMQCVENVSSYLRLHGVPATQMRARESKDNEPEEELLEIAKKKDANLIVMGAYSRSRWREVILGGFTRYLLKNSQIPLLLAH